MTNTPRSRRLTALAGGLGVALAAPMAGLVVALSAPPSGPALADCSLGFIDNPATPGQCVPIPGEGQERASSDTPAPPGGGVADNATGSDLSACDLSQPYTEGTVCPGAPAAPGSTTGVQGPINVTAPPPVGAAGNADTSACDLTQPYQTTLCP